MLQLGLFDDRRSGTTLTHDFDEGIHSMLAEGRLVGSQSSVYTSELPIRRVY
jgi:hypothetical protein